MNSGVFYLRYLTLKVSRAFLFLVCKTMGQVYAHKKQVFISKLTQLTSNLVNLALRGYQYSKQAYNNKVAGLAFRGMCWKCEP